MFFWAQTSEAQKAAVIGTTKLRSLSYLTVLKLSNTHKFMLTTHTLQKIIGYICEGEQLGEKLHVYGKSVY